MSFVSLLYYLGLAGNNGLFYKTSNPSCIGHSVNCNLKFSSIRPSPAVKVKVATQKLQIFTLATPTVKNTPTILFILLFISLKYYFF